MEHNTPKFRLRLNLFDGIVLLLALGVAAFLLWSNLKGGTADAGASGASTTSTVRYTVRFQKWPQGNSQLIQEGDRLIDNVKKYEMGHVVSYEVVPSVTRLLDHESKKYVQATYEGYEDVLVTVEAPCTVTEEAIVVDGGYQVRAGVIAYVKGEGYMASGPIVSVEREV